MIILLKDQSISKSNLKSKSKYIFKLYPQYKYKYVFKDNKNNVF